jgi:plastocyanin domain-containing protein
MKKNLTIFLPLVLAIIAIGGFALAQKKAEAQTAKVSITAKGFEPASVNLKANVPAKLTFLRTTNDTCATEVVLPDYKIKKDLPLNKAVDVEFTPTKAGDVAFACGMNMFKGKIVVAP